MIKIFTKHKTQELMLNKIIEYKKNYEIYNINIFIL